jgi:hypothetical protein
MVPVTQACHSDAYDYQVHGRRRPLLVLVAVPYAEPLPARGPNGSLGSSGVPSRKRIGYR